MEVVDRDHQHDTLLQAVQNHGPQVVIVDEIGSKEVSVKPVHGNKTVHVLQEEVDRFRTCNLPHTLQDVRAVRSIAHRGVSMVATAHGVDLSSLMRNPELLPLLGGIKVWGRHAATVASITRLAAATPDCCDALETYNMLPQCCTSTAKPIWPDLSAGRDVGRPGSSGLER
jgi:hypothetical protein